MPNFAENFGTSALPGALEFDHQLRAVLADAIKRSPKKREQIAEEMSHLLGREFTVRMLNDFTAESKAGYRWPASWTAAFCKVTKDERLVRLIAESCGFFLVDSWELDALRIGQRVIATKTTQREVDLLVEEAVARRPRA